MFRLPKTRTEFWNAKINKNRERDKLIEASLLSDGWRVALVWECALKGKHRLGEQQVLDALAEWLVSDLSERELRGKK